MQTVSDVVLRDGSTMRFVASLIATVARAVGNSHPASGCAEDDRLMKVTKRVCGI